MEVSAIFLSMLVSVLVAIFLPFFFLGKRYKAAQEKARQRRLVDAEMNARLLRLDL